MDGHAILRVDSGRSDIDTSLTEFLIGLLAVTLDPIATGVHWIDRWNAPPKSAEFEAAFEPFAAALVVDGPGPRFFQDFDDLDGAEESVAALFMDAPAVHFNKPGGITKLSRRGAALALLTLQTSAPSGGRGHRTSVRGGGPLTTLVVPGPSQGKPATLWQRLWANMPEGYGAKPEDLTRVFPWTVPTRTSEKGSATFETRPDDVHKAYAFFGMPRRIRLRFEANEAGEACDLTGDVDEVMVKTFVTRPSGNNYVDWGKSHPLSPCYKPNPREPVFLPTHLRSARIGYRDWLGYVFKEQGGNTLPAQSVEDFFKRADGLIEDADPAIVRQARIQVSAIALDNMKPLEYGEALLPLLAISKPLAEKPRLAVLEALRELARTMVKSAEISAGVLSAAIRRGLYGDAPNVSRDASTLEAAKARLWADTEHAFFERMAAATSAFEESQGAPAPEIKTAESRAWLAILRNAALDIFDDVVPIDSADSRSLEDYRQIVEARSQLRAALEGLTPKGNEIWKALNLAVPATKKSKKGGADARSNA